MKTPILKAKYDFENAPRNVKRAAKHEASKAMKLLIPFVDLFLTNVQKINNYDFSNYPNADLMYEKVYEQNVKETNTRFISFCKNINFKFFEIDTYYFQNYMRFNYDKK